jgi:DNA-directed RNA polymerase specialized sigma subunit
MSRSRGAARRNEMILGNRGLVVHLVRNKYPDLTYTNQFDDYVQSGLVGLIKAVDAYIADQVIGDFGKYARVCILSELQTLEASSLTSLLPARDRRDRVRIRRKHADLSKSLGRAPTNDEIREHWEAKKKPSDALIDRSLEEQPRVFFGLDSGSAHSVQIQVDARIEESIDAKRTLDKLDDLEPIDARLRKAV